MPITIPSLPRVEYFLRHPTFRSQPLRVLSRVARWELIRALNCLAEIPFDGDSKVLVSSADGVGRVLYYFGDYEGHIQRVFDRFLGSCRLFVEVGANFGLYSVFAAKRMAAGGRVLAFEPNPEVARRCRYNIDGLANVELREIGVGAKSERLLFRATANTATGMVVDDPGAGDTFSVQIEPLDDLVTDQIDLLKIDVEGHEAAVLAGASRLLGEGRVRVMHVETGYLQDPTSFMALLRRYGFKPYDIRDIGLVEVEQPEAFGHDTLAFGPDSQELLALALAP